MYSDLLTNMEKLLDTYDCDGLLAQAILNLVKEHEQLLKGAILWSVKDMQSYAANNLSIPYEMSDALAQEALEDMIKHHDANYGIGWSDVEYYCEKYRPKTVENDNNL